MRELHRPRNVAEVTELISLYHGQVTFMGGGTDLLIKQKEGLIDPQRVVCLMNAADMGSISPSPAVVAIGAAVSLQRVADCKKFRRSFTALVEGAASVGSWQVRNLATIGGNLCNAAPSADTAPALMALEARVKLVNGEERLLTLEEFFAGPGKTVLRPGEFLAEILVPVLPDYSGSCYLKHGPRGAMDIAVAGVAAQVTLDAEGVCRDARLALGAVAPTPMRAHRAEQALVGNPVSESVLAEAGRLAAKECAPISDLRASADYRREMVEVLTQRALMTALARAMARAAGEKGGAAHGGY